MTKLNDTTFTAHVRASHKPVLVDFATTWCGPCKLQKPILEKYAAEHPEVDIVHIDPDESPETASAYQVQAVPTLMLFVGGEKKAVVQGLQSPARLDALLARA